MEQINAEYLEVGLQPSSLVGEDGWWEFAFLLWEADVGMALNSIQFSILFDGWLGDLECDRILIVLANGCFRGSSIISHSNAKSTVYTSFVIRSHLSVFEVVHSSSSLQLNRFGGWEIVMIRIK